MIGDPTGRSGTREQLTEKEVKENAETYKNQISKVLDINKIEIAFNSKWLSSLDLKDIIELTARHTVARMLERDDFSKRYKKGDDISMVEFFYPLLQAYDSVVLKADIELGGTDQKFNLLLGRTIQKRYGQEGQVVMTTPLLEGTDGVEKMSKSIGNYIGISENSKDMFGKLMSIPDVLILKYMELLTDIPRTRIDEYNKEMKKGKNPRDIKIILAKEIVMQYHDKDTAEKEEENFSLLFSKKVVHDDIPIINLFDKMEKKDSYTAYEITSTAADLLGMNLTNNEKKRLIKQGAVSIDEKKVTDVFKEFPSPEDDMVIKIGKKTFARHRASR